MQFKSVNPATEEIFGEFSGMNFEETCAAARKCREAQKKWRTTSIMQRCKLLKNLASVLRKNIDACAKIITLEMGKPIMQAKAEVEKCAWLCDFFAERATEFLQEEGIKTEAKKSYLRFDPLGVILGIMPWNFPFWQVFRFAVPALAAGNGILLKHASNVPQCSLSIQEIFQEAGAPENLFQAFLIDSQIAGQLIETDTVDAVSLTGSTQAGALVAEKAGRHIKKCVLELGGSDPFIVLADADINLACQTALQARIINTGQSCIAAKRFIFEKSIAEEATQKIIEYFKTLTIGDPMDEIVNIGPLAKSEIRHLLEGQVENALSLGAQLLFGGHRIQRRGYFFEPTLLSHITPEMAVYREEVFGPVMTLFSVEDVDEAINIANDSEFGLGASIWTKNLTIAERIAAQIEAGFVSINGMVKSDPRLPFGGIKKSGFGRELGSYGIKEFVNIKTVVIH